MPGATSKPAKIIHLSHPKPTKKKDLRSTMDHQPPSPSTADCVRDPSLLGYYRKTRIAHEPGVSRWNHRSLSVFPRAAIWFRMESAAPHATAILIRRVSRPLPRLPREREAFMCVSCIICRCRETYASQLRERAKRRGTGSRPADSAYRGMALTMTSEFWEMSTVCAALMFLFSGRRWART